MKKSVLLMLMVVSSLALAQASETHRAQMKIDRDAVNQACQADAHTAGCDDKKINTGLRKCL